MELQYGARRPFRSASPPSLPHLRWGSQFGFRDKSHRFCFHSAWGEMSVEKEGLQRGERVP